jgi:hypothetical protein
MFTVTVRLSVADCIPIRLGKTIKFEAHHKEASSPSFVQSLSHLTLSLLRRDPNIGNTLKGRPTLRGVEMG